MTTSGSTPLLYSAAKSSGRILAISAVAEGLNLGKLAVLGYFFGAGRTMDVFFAAMTLFNLSVKVLQAGALSAIFLPIFLETKQKGDEASVWRTTSNLLNIGLLAGGVLALILIVIAPWVTRVMVAGFEPAARRTVVSLFRLMTPIFSITIGTSLAIAILNANKRFGWPESFSVANQVVNLLIIGVFIRDLDVYTLALGALAGNAVQFLLSLMALRRLGYRHTWRVDVRDPMLRNTFVTIRPYYLYMAIMQASTVFGTSVISFLPVGSFSIYRYASDLMARFSGLLSKPINTVAYSYIAEANVLGRTMDAARKVVKALKMTLLVTVGPMLILLLTRRQVVRILLEHGKFDRGDSALMAMALGILTVGLFLNAAFDLFSRTLVSLKRTLAMNIVAGVLQVVSLTVLFAMTQKWGLPGALWAAPAGTLVGIALLALTLRQGGFPAFSGGWDIGFLKIVAAAGIAYALCRVFLPILVEAPLLRIGAVSALFLAAFVLSSELLRLEELHSILKASNGWLRARRQRAVTP